MSNEIEIEVKLKDDQVAPKLARTEQKAKQFSDRTQERLKKFGAAATLGLGVVGVAAGKIAVAMVGAASDAQQSLGATEAIFGRYSKSIIDQSKKASDAVGLSANEYRENANLIGSLFKNQGVAADQLASKTQRVIKIGADLAATYGGTAKEAVEALTSAYKGEFDPLERYGVSLKQSTINTEAYRLANVKGLSAFNKLTAAQQTQYKQQATTNILLKQSKDATGQWAAQQDTLAEKIQSFKAKLTDLGALLGEKLLGPITHIVDKGGDFVDMLSKKIPDAIRTFEDAYKGVNLDGSGISKTASELSNLNRALGKTGDSVDATKQSALSFGKVMRWVFRPDMFIGGLADLTRMFKAVVLEFKQAGLKIQQYGLSTALKVQEAFGKLPGKVGAHFRKLAENTRKELNSIQGKLDDVNAKQLQNRLNGVIAKLTRLGNMKPSPKISAQIGQALRAAARIEARLRGIKDRYVNVFVSEVQRDNVKGGHHVGGYAHGGIVGAASGGPRSGLTMVGEHGRELVKLAPGSQVYPNGTTEAMMRRGAADPAPMVLEIKSSGSRLDDALVEIIRRAVRARGGDVQVALGRI